MAKKIVTAKHKAAVKVKKSNIKNLLIVTALIEAVTGLMLIVSPSFLAKLLLGSELEAAVSVTVAQIAGLAILTLGIASWRARVHWQSDAARGLITAMTFYNIGILILLVYAGFGLDFICPGLWTVVVVHLLMSAWCISALMNKSAQV
jgi:hypothetical protein